MNLSLPRLLWDQVLKVSDSITKFMAVTGLKEPHDVDSIMRSAVFWVVMSYSSERSWRFGGIYILHLQGRREATLSLPRVFCLAYSPILKMEALYSSETSVCVTFLRCYNPEVHILQIWFHFLSLHVVLTHYVLLYGVYHLAGIKGKLE
jgi:hypothetical protein